MFADVLFALPNYRKALVNAISKLKTGGRVAISDFKLAHGRLQGINHIWRKWSHLFGGDFGRTPWQDLEELLGNIQMAEYWFGLCYLAFAKKGESK